MVAGEEELNRRPWGTASGLEDRDPQGPGRQNSWIMAFIRVVFADPGNHAINRAPMELRVAG